ncbi:MAG: hypothetical protein P4L81_05885 [Candidatus Pacebacteria bacterium]|nr:hypothetical protein [Candidatus Paceibacterota bacterium]
MKTTRIIGIVIIVIVIIAAVVGLWVGGGGTNSPASQASAASSTVAAFGKTLQQVSLLAPNASSTIASTYAPYVDPSLLKQWEANPQSAPGRVVSSPWPDHIQIDSVTPQGSGYVVDGKLIFMTSDNTAHGGNAGTTPIVAQLLQENGSWMIIAFQGQKQH